MDTIIWNDLLDAADAYRALQPWTWMADEPCFGIHDSVLDLTGYCCVLGAAGTLTGLVVYDGRTGFACLREIAEDRVDAIDGAFQQHVMSISFLSRDELEPAQYRLIKHLGRRYRGREAWPEIVVRRPKMVPRLPTDVEVRFLTHVLRESIDLCSRVRAQPSLLMGGLLVRRDGEDTFPGEPELECDPPAVQLDELALRRGIHERSVSNQGWWGDWFSLPSAISDPEGDYFVRLAFWLDLDTGCVLTQKILHPDDNPTQVLHRLLLEETGVAPLPSVLMFRREEAARAFDALVDPHGPIELRISHSPGPTLELMEAFAPQVGGRSW